MTIQTPIRLAASLVVPTPTPERLRTELAEHLSSHARIETAGNGDIRLSSELGSSLLTLEGGSLRIAAESGDATGLAFIKMIMAEHVLELAGSDTPLHWSGDGAAGSPLPFFRAMTVVSVDTVGRFRRLVLRGDDLARFAEGGLHVRLLLPPKGHPQRWPVTGEDGRPFWPDRDPPPARIYTLRQIDVAAGRVEIDMLLHVSHGDPAPGSDYAARAEVGDVIGMTGPGGGELPDAPAYLMFADETALPAVARMLREMPAGRSVRAFIEIEDEADRQALPTDAEAEITWLQRSAGDGLEAAVLAITADSLQPETVVWGGMEHAMSRLIRRRALDSWGIPRDRLRLASYWRRGRAGGEHHHDE